MATPGAVPDVIQWGIRTGRPDSRVSVLSNPDSEAANSSSYETRAYAPLTTPVDSAEVLERAKAFTSFPIPSIAFPTGGKTR